MKFELYAAGVCVGWSNLENADAPMGCAAGVFYPNENYRRIEAVIRRQSAFSALDEPGSAAERASAWADVVALKLVVKAEDGAALEPGEGVHLLDVAVELGDETGRELSVIFLPPEQFKRYLRAAYDWYYQDE